MQFFSLGYIAGTLVSAILTFRHIRRIEKELHKLKQRNNELVDKYSDQIEKSVKEKLLSKIPD